jgi:hypothetical protein
VAHPPTVGTSTGDAAEQRRIAGVAGVGLHDDGGQVSRALRSGSRSTRTSTPCAASATSRWWSAAPQLMTRSRRPGSVATRCRFQSACNSTASSTIRYRQVPAAHPRDLSERAERAGTGLGFEHRGGAQGVLYGHDQPVGSVHCGPPLEACPFSRAGPRTRSRQGEGPVARTVRPFLAAAAHGELGGSSTPCWSGNAATAVGSFGKMRSAPIRLANPPARRSGSRSCFTRAIAGITPRVSSSSKSWCTASAR